MSESDTTPKAEGAKAEGAKAEGGSGAPDAASTPDVAPAGPRMSPQERSRRAAGRRRTRAQAGARASGSSSTPGMRSLYYAMVTAVIAVWVTFIARILWPTQIPLKPDSVTAPTIQLPDGRYMAVHELGAAADAAKHTVLVLHDLDACRLSMLPNVTQPLLRSMGVRLVSYDRPGYGQSEPFPSRTVRSEAWDILDAAGPLQLGDKFYVLGVGMGSYAAWSALRYIPHRLAGVAMVAPWGSLSMPSLRHSERVEMWQAMPRSDRVPLLFAKLGAWAVNLWYAIESVTGKVSNRRMPDWLTGKGMANIPDNVTNHKTLLESDLTILNTTAVKGYLVQMKQEALKQGPYESVYRDLAVVSAKWGFDLADISAAIESGESPFSGPIHIWHGTDDRVAGVAFSRYAKRAIPLSVVLHELPYVGHYFVHEDEVVPRKLLMGLLGIARTSEEQEAEFKGSEAATKVWG